MSETKEQIITELINELIAFIDDNKSLIGYRMLNDKLHSLLPTETPEKIAERKAEEMMRANGYTSPKLLKVLIEALLTDIKTK